MTALVAELDVRHPRTWNVARRAPATVHSPEQIAEWVPAKTPEAVGYSVPIFAARVGASGPLCALDGCKAGAYRNGLCGTHFMDVWRTGTIVRAPVLDTCAVCGASIGVRVSRGARRRVCANGPCKSLHNRYRITPLDHARLMAATACDACGGPAVYGGVGAKVLVVDHDHQRGTVRGFIDSSCNLAIGLVQDRPNVLLALAGFLETRSPTAVDAVPFSSVGPHDCPLCSSPKAVSLGSKPTTYCGPACRGLVGAIKRSYSLEPQQYLWMSRQHAGRCWACDESFSTSRYALRAVLDHDHDTGFVRGLIHDRCNVAIGRMDDSPSKLRALAAYLELAA